MTEMGIVESSQPTVKMSKTEVGDSESKNET